MNKLQRFGLTGLAALVMGFGAAKGLEAATLRVPSQYPTIQAGLNAAQSGDEVLVAPGTYAENVEIPAKAITLRSEAGYNSTKIVLPLPQVPSPATAQVILIKQGGTGNQYTIDGFTIDSFNSGGIIGIYDNSAGRTGTIVNSLIQNCDRGILDDYNNDPIYFHNNIVRNNHNGIVGRALTIDHNLIYGNRYAITLDDAPLASFRHNTLVNNGQAVTCNYSHFSDNIIANNGDVSIENSYDDGNNDLYENNSIESVGIIKTGCPDISKDPLFCDPTNGNYSLHSNSPCAISSCNLIGAFQTNCESTPTVQTTWGQLKVKYR